MRVFLVRQEVSLIIAYQFYGTDTYDFSNEFSTYLFWK